MKILLHGGMGKTGTTALQKVLAKNRSRLAKTGVIYPNFMDSTNHAGLCLLAMQKTDKGFPRGYRLREDSELEDMRNQVEQSLTDAASADGNILLLSTEYVFYMKKASQIKLRERLEHISPDIEFVAYLRNPVDYHFSLMAQRQRVIGGIKYDDILSPRDYRMDLAKKVKTAQTVWGKTKFYPYEPKYLVGQNIIPDFFARNLSGSVDFLPSKWVRSNESAAGGKRHPREVVKDIEEHWSEDVWFFKGFLAGFEAPDTDSELARFAAQ